MFEWKSAITAHVESASEEGNVNRAEYVCIERQAYLG